jgi:membrane dipeptidase
MPLVFSLLKRSAPISPEVLAFHQDSLVLDLHIDTLLWMRLFGYDIAKRHRNLLPTSPFCYHLDLPRARQGGLNAVVLAVMVNPSRIRREQTLPNKLLAKIEKGHGIEQTLATLEMLTRTAERHRAEMTVARSGSELQGAVAAGRLGVLPGLEGAHGLEGDLANLQAAHDRGLRLIRLRSSMDRGSCLSASN